MSRGMREKDRHKHLGGPSLEALWKLTESGHGQMLR